MGSTFSPEWRGKREMIKHLRAHCAPYRELDHAVVKSHDRESILYRLLEHTETHVRVIAVDIIYPAKAGYGSGYKGMDESMGPCETTCPPRIIERAGPPPNEWARAWRERCMARAYPERYPHMYYQASDIYSWARCDDHNLVYVQGRRRWPVADVYRVRLSDDNHVLVTPRSVHHDARKFDSAKPKMLSPAFEAAVRAMINGGAVE